MKFKPKSVRTMLGNPNPDKVVEKGIQDEFTVSPGDASLGGIKVKDALKPPKGFINLKRFYKGQK